MNAHSGALIVIVVNLAVPNALPRVSDAVA